jgi:hypothetical protein
MVEVGEIISDMEIKWNGKNGINGGEKNIIKEN